MFEQKNNNKKLKNFLVILTQRNAPAAVCIDELSVNNRPLEAVGVNNAILLFNLKNCMFIFIATWQIEILKKKKN